MSDYVTGFHTANGVKKYDYNSLANLPAAITPPRIATVNLLASDWQTTSQTNLHSQVVTIEGVTETSQVDLTPSAEQLATFHQKDIALVAENEDGVVTVYAIGDKPANDYTMQVTIKEVVV